MSKSIGLRGLSACIAACAFACLLNGCTARSAGGTNAAAATDTNTLRYALVTEPTTLDPAKTQDLVTGEMLAHVFEGLVRYNEKNEIEPALAEKWEISADGKTYTFHIRPNVKFQNGRVMTADDVKYSWERALNRETRSNVAVNYLDGVLGEKELAAGKRNDLPGVVVVDPQTLKVSIDRPRAFFLGMLSYSSNDVVCREAIAKNGGTLDDKAMVGTGPYRLESYRPGSLLTLKANPDYWGGPPKMARIEMPVILDPETIYNNFETGKIDMWPEQIPYARYAQDRDAHKFTGEYKLLPAAQVDYLVLHPIQQPAFAKKEVRQAFALAINRDEIVKLAYKGIGQRADGMLPPGISDAGSMPPAIPYDPARAKQLLAQAGYPDGKGFPTLTLITLEHTPIWQEACQVIRANLRDNLGITVNLQEREASQYWDDSARETMEFYLTGWIADYPDPQDFLTTLFDSHSSLDHVKYHNPQFDALCEQADAETNKARRATLYGQANAILMQDVGAIPIACGPRVALIQQNVQGWRANLLSMLPNTQATKR